MKWVAAVAVLCCACRSSSVGPYEMAETRIHESVARGLRSSSEQGPADIRVRFNPAAQCACPAYEIYAYGRWTRAFVDAEHPSLEALRTGDPLGEATLMLLLEAKPRAAENGVLYPVASAP